MKRLTLITLVLVTVVLAGFLHGNYTKHGITRELLLKEVYTAQYPVTIPTETRAQTINVPF